MPFEERAELYEPEQAIDSMARKSRADNPILTEIIKVLAPYPGGLRRWSVMRAIRSNREHASRDIPQKLEDEVERAFRRCCADMVDSKGRVSAASDALFYRPREKAGEVWAVFPERAKAWLEGEPAKNE